VATGEVAAAGLGAQGMYDRRLVILAVIFKSHGIELIKVQTRTLGKFEFFSY
jgi:hypothetical protein